MFGTARLCYSYRAMTRLILCAFVFIPVWAAVCEIAPPFAEDRAWLKTFEQAETAQAAGGQTILILFWSAPNRDTENLERNLNRWASVPELLASYIKVSLRVEDHRDLAVACGIQSVPSLALIGKSKNPNLKERVLGVLEKTDSREQVAKFLETGAIMNTLNPMELLAEEAEVNSVTQLVRQAEADLQLRKYNDVFQGLEQAVHLLPQGTSEQHLRLHLKLADLYYKSGRFDEAIDRYREALKSLEKNRDPETALHIFIRLALLLNDQGENEEAVDFLDQAMEFEKDPENVSEHEEERKAFLAGLYVLAGRGYPGVGLEPPLGGGAGVEEATEESELGFEEKMEKVSKDLDQLEAILKQAIERDGAFPNFLDELPELEPADEKVPKDPFTPGFPYLYLHLENPEDYVLYSVGPDGEDQFGEEVFAPEKGSDGKGDVVRRFRE
ncbi:MAG: tetratricopeptide repeat protein [Candidatus Omnitrophica bacterium]|nr:tetratricopeptide repeat protein [Candidatus Omnitrophota bacterium]